MLAILFFIGVFNSMETIESIIRREYVDNKKNMVEIAKQLKVGRQYVKGYLKRMNIDIRPVNRSLEDFIEKAISIHGNRYDYSLFEYKGACEPGIIICKEHGQFSQKPNNHYKEQGCPRCKESHGENKINNYLAEIGIKYSPQYRIKECKNKNPLPFDFAVWVNNNIGLIEYNGAQHYIEVKTWSTRYNQLEYVQNNDRIKSKYCKVNNIPLLVIPYYNEENIVSLIDQFLLSL